MSGTRAMALLLTATLAHAQEAQSLLVQLSDGDLYRAEAARRQLATRPLDATTGAELAAQLRMALAARDSDPDLLLRLCTVLAAHDLAREVRAGLLQRSEPELLLAALPLAEDQRLVALTAHPAAAVRRAALWQLEDRGRLTDALLAAALDDEDPGVARAAARLAAIERSPFPAAILPGLGPGGREQMARELAEHPRAAAVPWLQDLARAQADPRVRLLALAALAPQRVDAGLARQIVAAAAVPELAPEVRLLAERLAPEVADQLVGAVHARLEHGAPLDALLVCLERTSSLGQRQVLALARVLPAAHVERICDWLAGHGAKGLDEHIDAALDAPLPLESHLLRRCGPYLTSDARIDRVVAVLRLDAKDRRELAYQALLDRAVFRPAMLDFALEEASGATDRWSARAQRVRQLLRLPLRALPGAVLLRLLEHDDPHVHEAVALALTTSPFPEELETELLALARGSAPDAGAAARAIAAFGSQGAATLLWGEAGTELRIALAQALVARRRPWVTDLLRAALAGAGDDPAQRELRFTLQHALATLGDAAAAAALVRAAADLPTRWLARCAEEAACALTPELVAELQPCLLGERRRDAAAREQIAAWVARRTDLPVAPLLAELHTSDPGAEVRRVALGGLLHTEQAFAFHERLRAAMARPLTEAERELAFEILGAATPPLPARDVETLARLVLEAPLAEPVLPAAGSGDALPCGGDHPLHLAVVDCLRRDPTLDAAPLRAVAARIERGPHHALCGRRIGHLLVEAAPHDRLRVEVCPALARLVLVAPDATRPYAGAAHLILAEEAERQGRWAEAIAHWTGARELLRELLPPLVLRALCGEASWAEQRSPCSALAAGADLCTARARLAEGDRDAARAALARAEDLGAGDAATRQEIDDLKRRLDR